MVDSKGTGKIQIGASQGLQIIGKMIKDVALCKEAGMFPSAFNVKREGKVIDGYKIKMNPADIEKLNRAINIIGERLLSTKIEYTTDRQYVIDQIKTKLSDINMPYIYNQCMGKTTVWFVGRVRKPAASGKKITFKREDILQINLHVAEIAGKLLSIELIVDE